MIGYWNCMIIYSQINKLLYDKSLHQGQRVNQPFCPCYLSPFSLPQTDNIHKYLWVGNHLIYNQICKVMDNKSKRIGTFKQFLNEQRVKKINEANVNIECDWWDQAIIEVMQELETECQGFLVWETIIKYCKQKWAILGRSLPLPEYDDNLLTQHIKDLIFQFHGNSFYTDWKCDYGWDNQQVHSKGLVIEELAATILEKVREKTRPQGEPDTGETTGKLSDREKATLVPMKPAPTYDCEDEYCEDLPYESHKVRPVKGFSEYLKTLNETVAIIDTSSQNKCIQYCLDRVKEEVGSYNPDEIFNVAGQSADPKVKARLVLLYVKDMVADYLSNGKVQFGVVDATGKKGKDIPKEVWEEGLNQLCKDIADEVLVRIAEINGITMSDGEAE